MIDIRRFSIRKYVMTKAVLQFKLHSKTKSKQKLSLFTNANSIGIFLNLITFLLRKKLKVQRLKMAFSHYKSSVENSQSYFKKLIHAFRIDTNMQGPGAHNIEMKGPVIFYANHPFSGMDAFGLAAEIEKIRPDVKVLAASYLQNFPGFKEKAFIINVQDKLRFKDENKKVYQTINKHIRQGKSLLIFPAGDVSSWSKKNKLYALDPPWKDGLIHFGQHSSETSYIPVFIQGEPSRKYLKLRLKAKLLSNFYVLREFANQINTQMVFSVGKSIPIKSMASLPIHEKTMYLRAKLYELGTQYFQSINGSKQILQHCTRFPLLTKIESSLLHAVDTALIKQKMIPVYINNVNKVCAKT
jgi:hypothetical protein